MKPSLLLICCVLPVLSGCGSMLVSDEPPEGPAAFGTDRRRTPGRGWEEDDAGSAAGEVQRLLQVGPPLLGGGDLHPLLEDLAGGRHRCALA